MSYKIAGAAANTHTPQDNHAPPKTPLQYRRDGDGALIYSIGENGVDDGGVFEKVENIGYRIGKPHENPK